MTVPGNAILYEARGRTLRVGKKTPGWVEVAFKWPIAQVVVCQHHLVVRLGPPPGAAYNQNVFGVSTAGQVAWQIEDLGTVYEDSPYTNIACQDGVVVAWNWDGGIAKLDPETGRVLEVGYGK